MRFKGGATVRVRPVVICALAILALCAWVSCGDEEEGPRSITAPCEELAKTEKYRYVYRYRIHSPKPDTPVDETQVGEPPFAIQPNGETFTFEQIYDGDYISPDRFLVEVSTPSEPDSASLTLLFVGNEAWTKSRRQDQEVWIPQPNAYNTYPAQSVCEGMIGAVEFAGLTPTAERLNDQDTQHVRADNAALEIAAKLFGPESDMGRLAKDYSIDVWVSRKGWPVRLQATSVGTMPSGRQLFLDLSLEIDDVNSGDIEIQAPRPPE